MIDYQGKDGRTHVTAKEFIECNVWDGDCLLGGENYKVAFNSDELQQLIDELLEYLIDTETIKTCNDKR